MSVPWNMRVAKYDNCLHNLVIIIIIINDNLKDRPNRVLHHRATHLQAINANAHILISISNLRYLNQPYLPQYHHSQLQYSSCLLRLRKV